MLSNDDFKAFQGNAKDLELLFKLHASFLLHSAAELMVRKIFFCTKHFLVHVKKLAKRHFKCGHSGLAPTRAAIPYDC